MGLQPHGSSPINEAADVAKAALANVAGSGGTMKVRTSAVARRAARLARTGSRPSGGSDAPRASQHSIRAGFSQRRRAPHQRLPAPECSRASFPVSPLVHPTGDGKCIRFLAVGSGRRRAAHALRLMVGGLRITSGYPSVVEETMTGWTSTASPSNPLRMSVTPHARNTRVGNGVGLIPAPTAPAPARRHPPSRPRSPVRRPATRCR